MTRMRVCALVAVFFLVAPFLGGQESKAGEGVSETPLKIEIVLTEFDGTRKVNSLPYSLNILGTGIRDRQRAHLRYGVRVPVVVQNSLTYEDVGTKIDCGATRREDGAYQLDLVVVLSSVSMPEKGGANQPKAGDTSPDHPLILSFDDDFTVVIRNGQTVEGTSAVDPVTGHVLKVDVTLNALKE